ncbi:MAG: T9SS type A sorting domain-containing protein [Bacteroidetes bacterium]|nr:T9SS type A sorting domain-containing protein [Bacteroidota bacterium]
MKKNLLLLSMVLLCMTATFAQSNVSYNINNVPIGGAYNTAFGFQSLTSASGSRNSALGYEALKANTSGIFNTGIGEHALTANTWGAYNTAVGSQTMNANSTGIANTAHGYQTLYSNTSGNYNTASGLVSLQYNTTGLNNTGHGAATLLTNTIGSGNTALGFYADVTTNNLSNATAIGNEAKVSASNTIQLGNNAVTAVYAGTGTTAKLIAGGLQVTGGTLAAGKVLVSDALGNATWQTLGASGSGWSLVGNGGTVDGTNFIGTTDNVPLNLRVNNQVAGRIESSASGNTSFGFRSGNMPGGSGVKNTAIGYYALQANTSGRENVANGYYALRYNTTGNHNTAIGFAAMEACSTGYQNTSTGYASMANNWSGFENTATGSYALYYNTTGYENTATGYQAMHGNSIGSHNTAMGGAALIVSSSGSENVAMGWGTLSLNSSGSQNTALGCIALGTNTTGTQNVGLGYLANVSTNNLTNASAVGANAVVNASNKVRIGNTTVTVIEGQVAFSNPSDGRFKNNISEEDVKGLDFINRLRPVVYNLDTRKFQEFLTKNMADSVRAIYLDKDFSASTAIRQSGFIAQEVEQAAKEIGYDFNGVHVPQDENDNYSLAYSQFVVPLVKGMQEQQGMIEAQNVTLAKQQAQIAALQQLVAALVDSPAEKGASVMDEVVDVVAIYPNPTAGSFTVYTQTLDAGRIEISDVSGTVVQAMDLVKDVYSYGVDLSGQAKGVYLVRVMAEGKVITKKLILE